MLTPSQYLGLDNSHLLNHQGHWFEAQTLQAFLNMVQAAKDEGICIDLASSFRSFNTQLSIWNNKATGKRPLLDQREQPLDFKQLSEQQIVEAILLWSALPGTSRHHWGTDLDLYDSSAIAIDELQLISTEYQQTGPCAKMANWLEHNAAKFGFYRPFVEGKSGVGPEPWHYSYWPASQLIMQCFDIQQLTLVLEEHNICCKQSILENLDNICERYFYKVALPLEQA
ncbi:M15 family metallopeptidase [Paraferrimonas sp. SM1919]|uniref:M15 family metallopeptidase n=1 Tax=Paraferrimonas sp. SM1919 TaxID=2662263 RepID=UPI0013D421C7|nr:M15 family metallopeptidase [Paraferrimonas sp. SM1919]